MTLSIPARWQKIGRSKPIRLIVVHCTVSPEMGTGAEAVANYFASVSRPASTHLVSDNNSTVRCVADGNTAYGAAGVNSDGLHIELVGYPTQSRVEWLDAYSRAELHEAGPHIAGWSQKYGIPLRWLTVGQVRDGRTRGLCTHNDASRAFPEISTGHWDPGPEFPKGEALKIWDPQPSPTPEPAPELEDDDVRKIVKGDTTPQWWITDGITARHVKDRKEAGILAFEGLARWNNGEAFIWPQDKVDRLVKVA